MEDQEDKETGAIKQEEGDEGEDPPTTDKNTYTSSALTDASAAEKLASPAHLDESSDITQAESRADSPVIVSSETDHSTIASSLSELTDETVQGKGARIEGEHNTATAAVAVVKADTPVGRPGNVEIIEISESPRGSAEIQIQEDVPPGQNNPEPERDETGELGVPKLMVPKSKFSTQDLAGATKGGSSSPPGKTRTTGKKAAHSEFRLQRETTWDKK
ncbi:hypothetical protein ESCO_004422 [Escovopsis weberi]|uniref:Uncharacterized protein n=1 Tax=Escovopsis weberi TaxID=150374 RepID=A0A0M9VVR7_ESCWE|nr:hypothetical protein ESCO_004422 [Escovopsis weberi]